MLETARASWKRHLERESARRRELKRRDRKARRGTDGEIFVAWHENYFEGDQADLWRVAGLGNCERCGHRLIHHGGYACSGCRVDPNVAWDERCRASPPDPG